VRRGLRGFLGTVVVVLGLVGGLASSAGAGGNVTLTVEKVVNGPVPPGTTFTVDLNCTDDPDVGATTMTFDENGNPVPAGSNVVMWTSIPVGGLDCTPTEQPSDATASYSCTADGVVECESVGPQSEPINVSIGGTGSGTVTVTNSFPEPASPPEPAPLPQATPAPAVEATVAFTG
jgi:uncharacterized protein DUF5979